MIIDNIYIGSLEKVLEYTISNIDFSDIVPTGVFYDWGDLDALNSRINFESTNNSVYNALENDETKKKKVYPLIWYVIPNKGYKTIEDTFLFEDTRIIIAINTQYALLNTERWKSNFIILDKIANRLLSNLDPKYISIKKNSNNIPLINFEKHANYHHKYNNSSKQKLTDIWDALVLNIDFIIKTNCLKF